MKINRISESMGLISDEISNRAIEAFEKTSEKSSSISEEKPRVFREEKSRKAPIVIALAGLCAAAAVAVPLVLKTTGKNPITSNNVLSGAANSAYESALNNVPESILNKVSQSTLKEPSQGIYHEPQLTDDKIIAVNVEKLKVTPNGNKLTAVLDNENPNVNFYTVKFDWSKANTFAIVVNEDGTFKSFAGDNISKEEIQQQCPDGVYGEMWSINADEKWKDQWKVIIECDDYDVRAKGGSLLQNEGTVRTYQFWVANENNKEILEYWHSHIPQGSGGGLEIVDNGDGTFGAYIDFGNIIAGQDFIYDVEKLRFAVVGDDLSVVPDKQNPNVDFVTATFSIDDCKKYAFVHFGDGRYKTYSGYYASEETILKECPDADFAYLWDFGNGFVKIDKLYPSGKNVYGYGKIVPTPIGSYRFTYQFSYSIDEELDEYWGWLSNNSVDPKDGGAGLHFFKNADGTFGVFIGSNGDDLNELVGGGACWSMAKLNVSVDGENVSIARDEDNPNVRFITAKFDASESNKWAIVADVNGVCELTSKADISDKYGLTDDKIGIMMTVENGECQINVTENDKIMFRQSSPVIEKDGVYTLKFWVGDRDTVEEIENTLDGIIEIFEVYDHTPYTIRVNRNQAKSSVPPKNST